MGAISDAEEAELEDAAHRLYLDRLDLEGDLPQYRGDEA
jgi:hypothetical protein